MHQLEDPTVGGLYDDPDTPATLDPAEAQRLAEQAAAQRVTAGKNRADADELLAKARAQAQRITQDAEQRARELRAQATACEQRAQEREERANLMREALRLQGQVQDATDLCVELRDEHAELTAAADDLDTRIAALEDSRRAVQAESDQARGAGDVDALTAARTRMGALGEIISEVTARRDAARDRIAQIIAPGGTGLLADAVAAAQRALSRHGGALDQLDPTRPEQRRAQTVYRLAGGRPGVQPTEEALRAAAAAVLASEQLPDILDGFAQDRAEQAARERGERRTTLTRPDGTSATLVTTPRQ